MDFYFSEWKWCETESTGVRILVTGFIIVLYKSSKNLKDSWALDVFETIGTLQLGYSAPVYTYTYGNNHRVWLGGNLYRGWNRGKSKDAHPTLIYPSRVGYTPPYPGLLSQHTPQRYPRGKWGKKFLAPVAVNQKFDNLPHLLEVS